MVEYAAQWPVERGTVIPCVAEEKAMLVAYLDYYRETFALKCAGVEDRLSERAVAPSTMSLHGLLRHLAGVERWWFRINFAGEDVPLLYYSDDVPDQDFDELDGDVGEAFAVWQDECARSRAIVAAADLDRTAVVVALGVGAGDLPVGVEDFQQHLAGIICEGCANQVSRFIDDGPVAPRVGRDRLAGPLVIPKDARAVCVDAALRPRAADFDQLQPPLHVI